MKKTVMLLALLSTAFGEFICEAPESSNGPLPPILPENYHIVYERNQIDNDTSSFIDVNYDWINQKARIEEITETESTIAVVDFNSGFFYIYQVPRPGADESTDERDFLCRYFKISEDTRKKISFVNKRGKPSRMVDIYQALLFGGRYRYAFAGLAADDSSRFINTRKFQACIDDKETGSRLNVTYYWTVDESQPVKCEIIGKRSDDKDINEILSVVRFERDPKMAEDLYALPRHMQCLDDPNVVKPEYFPKLSDNFAWREETFEYFMTYDGKPMGDILESFREVWSSDHFKLARIDLTPSNSDLNKAYLSKYIGKPLSVIADMTYGAMFITEKITGICEIRPLTEEFPLAKKVNDTFILKPQMEILGMNGPKVLRDKYVERGIPVVVYSDPYVLDLSATTMSLHETTFRFDERQAEESNMYYIFAPVSQFFREIQTDPENLTPPNQTVVQSSYFRYQSEHFPPHAFEAPGCVAHHERKFYQLSFPGHLWTEISKRKSQFLNELRFQIFLRGDFGTVMRIENLDVYYHPRLQVVATMTLLEPLSEIKSSNHISIAEAAKKIADVVNEGHMSIPFVIKDSETVEALKQSFIEFSLGGESVSAKTLKRSIRDVVMKSDATIDQGYNDVSLLAVCAVAFLVGAAAGVLIVYLKNKSAASVDPIEVPLGDIRSTSQENDDHNTAGPSGWSRLTTETK